MAAGQSGHVKGRGGRTERRGGGAGTRADSCGGRPGGGYEAVGARAHAVATGCARQARCGGAGLSGTAIAHGDDAHVGARRCPSAAGDSTRASWGLRYGRGPRRRGPPFEVAIWEGRASAGGAIPQAAARGTPRATDWPTKSWAANHGALPGRAACGPT